MLSLQLIATYLSASRLHLNSVIIVYTIIVITHVHLISFQKSVKSPYLNCSGTNYKWSHYELNGLRVRRVAIWSMSIVLATYITGKLINFLRYASYRKGQGNFCSFITFFLLKYLISCIFPDFSIYTLFSYHLSFICHKVQYNCHGCLLSFATTM